MPEISYLDAKTAAAVDVRLMSEGLFTVEQLMELAGLSVAEVVEQEYATRCKVAIVCGPGNNGGDGLVAARHLAGFGYDVRVCSMKPPKSLHLERMTRLLDLCSVPVSDSLDFISSSDLIIDALFGFSFTGTPRAPFDAALSAMVHATAPVVSVDVPSGWGIDGPTALDGAEASEPRLKPAVLVSLMVPKLCAKAFTGTHYVGGRFLPPSVASEFEITQPRWVGSRSFVKLM